MDNEPQRHIEITVADQRLTLKDGDATIFQARISTARNGVGELHDSECTPRGWHRVHAKIGAGSAPGTVFVGRRPTGEIYTADLRRRHPERDWILTRILWLSGAEPGLNQRGRVDTLQRYIYIHGSPDDVPMGTPDSRGCIRMRNEDVMRLFDMVEEGTRVLIKE